MTVLRNVETVAAFTDKYGDERRIYRDGPRGRLKAEKKNDTVSYHMSRVASVLIGAKIKERRIAAGMTLEDLCLASGLVSQFPKHRMWEIENAIRNTGTRTGTLFAIAAALKCEVADFMPNVREVLERSGIHTEAQISLVICK